MAFKIFLDTNIVIDFFSHQRPNQATARKLFDLIELKLVNAFISETVITNAAYILRKDLGEKVIAAELAELSRLAPVLPCDSLIIQQAANGNITDFEDAILYHLALHHRLDYFITENGRDFKQGALPQLPVLNTAGFLQLL